MNDNKQLHDLCKSIVKTDILPGYSYDLAKNSRKEEGNETELFHYVTLTRPNGQELLLNFPYSWCEPITQINVSGRKVKDERNRCEYPFGNLPKSINISVKKTPEQIAKDIKKRFLTLYDPLYNKGREALQAQNHKRGLEEDGLNNIQDTLRTESKIHLQGIRNKTGYAPDSSCIDFGSINKKKEHETIPAPTGKISQAYQFNENDPIRYKLELDNVAIMDVHAICLILYKSRFAAIAERSYEDKKHDRFIAQTRKKNPELDKYLTERDAKIKAFQG